MGRGILKKHKSAGIGVAGKEAGSMRSKGFTFIELIVAVLLLSIIAAGMLGAFVGAQQFLNRSKHKMQAFNFARKANDKLRSSYQYASTQMDEGGHSESDIGGDIIEGEMLNLPPPPPALPLTYSVTETSGAYKEVRVSVKWKETTF